MSVTLAMWQPDDATRAFAQIRKERAAGRRARRKSTALGDRLFPWYLATFFLAYAFLFLSGTRDIRIAGQSVAHTAAGAAAISCLGCMMWIAVLCVLAVAAVAAIDGGPVALPAEDLRIALGAPVPRATLIRRALLIAYGKGLAAALAVAGLLLLVEVATLSQPFASCVLPIGVLSLSTAVAAVSVGWLVESTPAGRVVGRVIGALLAAALIILAAWVFEAAGTFGQLAAWHRLHRIAENPAGKVLSRAAQPTSTAGHAVPGLAVFAAIAAILASWGWTRTGKISAEKLTARSGRAVAIRTALLVGMTSSASLTRTAAARRRRTVRAAIPRTRGPLTAISQKASLQEQGTPLVVRVIMAAVTATTVDALLLAHHPHTSGNPALPTGIAAGLFLAASTSRFADPTRIDVELNAPAKALPLPFRHIAAANIAAPSVTYGLGALLAAVIVPALHLQRWSALPVLIIFGIVLGPLAAAVGALAATSNVPWLIDSSGTSIVVRLRGAIAATIVTTITAVIIQGTPEESTEGLPELAAVALALMAVVIVSWSTATAGRALQRNR